MIEHFEISKSRFSHKRTSEWAYLIYNPVNNLYKIGIAEDIRNRFLSIQAQSGFKLNLLLAVEPSHDDENANVIEKYLHAHFKNQRVIGEWFRLSSTDVSAIYEFFYEIDANSSIDNIIYPDKKWLQATNGR